MALKEDQIHRSIVSWLELVLPSENIVHHSANELGGDGRQAMLATARAKAMGMKAGWPDIVVLTFRGAVFMEVKAEGGRLSKAQKEMHARLVALGYPVGVVRSIDDARECLQDWGIGFRERR